MRTAPRAPGERKWWNARAFGILHRRPGPPPRFEEEIMERPIPLRERPIDIALVGFFLLNFFFITYIVDIEQITLPSTAPGWEYPLWPPKPFVDLIHWYGNGFDPAVRDSLFDFGVTTDSTGRARAHGMGLWSCQRIIQAHGGRIWAEAEPGQGARFTFTLPATDTAGAKGGA